MATERTTRRISGDLIENLRIYSGSSGALPNGTLPPSVHNGRSSSVAVPLPVTVMPSTDRIFFSIVQQQMLSMKFLQFVCSTAKLSVKLSAK
ncbi:unnamed protein product [Sphagnum jensenii]|uniref:Uncharacterized protein n=1 Tax=Sphagnum jensenii TaxID=128206 RepID=A0ABP1ACI3_9BRYO